MFRTGISEGNICLDCSTFKVTRRRNTWRLFLVVQWSKERVETESVFSWVTGMSRQLRHLCPETIPITVTEDVVFYPRYFTFVVRVRLSMPCPVHSKMINSLTQARRKQNLRPVYSPMDSSGRCLLTVQFPCSYFFNLKPEVRKT